ncbi:MAG: hypothetical protein ACR2NV_13980 [Thermoleophilaceae bacterium]
MRSRLASIARRIARRSGGQTAAEYIGVIALVVVIVGATLAAAPGIGTTVASEIRAAYTSVLGGGGDAGGGGAPGGPGGGGRPGGPGDGGPGAPLPPGQSYGPGDGGGPVAAVVTPAAPAPAAASPVAARPPTRRAPSPTP